MTENASKGSSVKEEQFQFDPWTATVRRSHILQSKCTTIDICETLKKDCSSDKNDKLCAFCRYEKELSLPQLPDMTFANNFIRVEHADGFGIEFNCLDALHKVDPKNDLMKVAVADAWLQSRANASHIREVVKPFDWTYTTDYKGTLFSRNKSMKMHQNLLFEIEHAWVQLLSKWFKQARAQKIAPYSSLQEILNYYLGFHQESVISLDTKSCFLLKVSETSERIDIEKLKVKEKILFYEDIHLFEDELADNGCAQCSVKMRVMQGSFFILLRYFLRVDNLFVRINDTRIYYEAEKNYMLREYTSKECRIPDLKVPTVLLTNPSELWDHLPTKNVCFEKLEFPS